MTRIKTIIPVDSDNPDIYEVNTKSIGPAGKLPLDDVFLRNVSSGDLFGLTENAGMGWPSESLRQNEYLILGTVGGLHNSESEPIALGYHTGHWEIDVLMKTAAQEFSAHNCIPFAGMLSDPCDGRTQGTPGMMDSLAFRNDAAIVFRRLIRSLPTRQGVLGIATCDKGLPALLMALASQSELPCVFLPGGVTLPPISGEDAGKVQTLSVRYAQGEISLEQAAILGCRACASPGGGCQFLGTAATGQVVGESLGLALMHSALAPSGQTIWMDNGRRSAIALMQLNNAGMTTKDILSEDAVHNAMVVFAAFGGSTNMLLHLPAIAHAAGLRRPDVAKWDEINRAVPRSVDVLPNGPTGYPTVVVYLAGGVPEVMLHLRDLDLLKLDVMTVHGTTLGACLDMWETSERRHRLRKCLYDSDGINPDDVIFTPKRARELGITSTLTFPRGNLAPLGAVIKSTALDPALLDEYGVYQKLGTARVFTQERDAIAAVKGVTGTPVKPGDVIVLIGRGPLGCGMEETYQITSALKHLSWGKDIALITDARFSGVSTGPCIGHIGPEALAGGPVGRVRDGDLIQIIIDVRNLLGSINLVGHNGMHYSAQQGETVLATRSPHPDLSPDPDLPDDTRLWALLQSISGGIWGGCVYDLQAIQSKVNQK